MKKLPIHTQQKHRKVSLRSINEVTITIPPLRIMYFSIAEYHFDKKKHTCNGVA